MDVSIKRSLNALTSMRFIAALVVFIWHTQLFASTLNQYRFGELGVGFFFLLSGFILTYVYFDKLQKDRPQAVKKFYIARFAKIYPLHILTFILAIPLMMQAYGLVLGGAMNWSLVDDAVANLLLVQAYSSDSYIFNSFNNVSWSISVEFFFYFIFPMVILILAKYKYLINVQRLVVAIFILIISMLLLNLYLPASYIITPLYRLPEFLVGVFTGLIFIKSINKTGDWYTGRKATICEALSVGVLVGSIATYPLISSKIAIVTWVIPWIVLLVYVLAHEKGGISRILAVKPLIFLGEISFSFYMLHMLVLRYMNGIGSLYISLAAIVVVTMLSAVVYFFAEEPARKRVKNYLEAISPYTFRLKWQAKILAGKVLVPEEVAKERG